MSKLVGFIKKTSLDYDLPYQQVKEAYDNCKGNLQGFYSDLEDIVSDKSARLSRFSLVNRECEAYQKGNW